MRAISIVSLLALSSFRAGETNISAICHFVYNIEFKNASLSSNENIKIDIEQIVTNWRVNHIACIVTDNATNMINACIHSKVQHLSCLFHYINLVVTGGLKDLNLEDLLQKIRTIVGHLKRSTTVEEKLYDEQRRYDSTKPILKLIQNVFTKPFENATVNLSGDTYATSLFIILIVLGNSSKTPE